MVKVLTYHNVCGIIISTREIQNHTGGKEMKELAIQAITEMGCCVYTTIKVSEDYTMNEVVREVRRNRFTSFRLVDTMKRFVTI